MSIEKNTKVLDLLGYKLKKTQHILRLRMDDALKSINLTTPQYAVLAQLEINPGISNASLARSAFITAQTMHGIISNLEKQALLTRKNDPHHGRILRAELTEKGHKVVHQAHLIIQNVEKKMTSTLNEESQKKLETLLIECFNNLI